MANNSKSLISLANLPVEDLAAYLSIVEGFSRKDERASDTDLVDGIDSDKIAIAALDENNNLINDRKTVENALKLAGIPANEYLKKDESTTLLDDTYQVSSIISSEVKEIRDELYQLKAELAKQGYIKQNHVYDGFYDAFRNDEIRYDDEIVTTTSGQYVSGSNIFTVIDGSDLHVGEFIAIKDVEGNMYASRISDIQNSNTIEIEKPFNVSANIATGANIYKYAGSYYNGEFIFGRDTGSYISNDVMKTIVKDGKDRTVIQVLGAETKGYATKLTNYYSTYGSLIRRVEFSLSYSGNPGAIRASVWKMDITSDKNRPICECLGTSRSVYPSSASNTLSEVEFIFDDPIRINEGSTYLIALFAGGSNENNVWKIGGYVDPYNNESDLFYIDDTYYFDNDVFDMIPGPTDSYLALHLSKEIKANIIHNDTGLYTCCEEINGGFTRARVELKINREGIYQIANDMASVTPIGNKIKIAGENNAKDPFEANDKIAVGQMFSTLTGDNTKDGIYAADELYTPAEADVYRIGYTVQVIAKRKLSDIPLVYGEDKIIELPLVCIMKGKESGKEAISSDRLIFEAEIEPDDSLDRKLKTYDLLEVQIYWNSQLDKATLNDSPVFAGKILDISVTTDKSYKAKK